MRIIIRWAWIPLAGVALVTWGLLGVLPAAPTTIFSDGALLSLLGGTVVIVGVILIAVLYTREQRRIRDLRHRGL